MVSIEKWASDLATELAKDDATAERSVASTIEQRIAIGLAHARAVEMEEAAAQVAGFFDGHIMCQHVARSMLERAKKLKKVAYEWSKKWPPDTEPTKEPEKLVKLAVN